MKIILTLFFLICSSFVCAKEENPHPPGFFEKHFPLNANNTKQEHIGWQDGILSAPSYRYSELKLDEKGNAIKVDSDYYVRDIKLYAFMREFRKTDTVLVLLDPWEGQKVKPAVYEYRNETIKRAIVPLVEKFIEMEFRVIILTNKDMSGSGCVKAIHSDLEKYVKSDYVEVYYNDYPEAKALPEKLRAEGVRNLIYTGGSSNGCMLGRTEGILMMRRNGFSTYFVPEASWSSLDPCEEKKIWFSSRSVSPGEYYHNFIMDG